MPSSIYTLISYTHLYFYISILLRPRGALSYAHLHLKKKKMCIDDETAR